VGSSAIEGVAPSAPAELDELTLARAKRGDERAWLALVRHHESRVFALVSRMLAGSRPASLVQDIAQDTFVRVLRALPEFDEAGAARLSSWILCIATRLTIDELRRQSAATTGDVDGFAASDRADLQAERGELGEALSRALASLTPTLRAVFVLREYHGLEYAEIARALDLHPANVATRLHRSRRALRAALSEEGWDV
jgi:RNA polymerase sigma-70 factor (ECF subfamily)